MSPARSDSSLAAVLLTQRLVKASVAPLKASEYWDLLARVPDLADLVGADAARLVRELGLDAESAERTARLMDAATSLAFELDNMEQSGVQVLASVDEGYPAALLRLGRAAPPLLYAAGDVSPLGTDLLGVVGSRDTNEHAAEIAKGAARTAVANGLGVVSGGAKGVDRLAMNSALDAGGRAVGVLADSLLRTTRDPDVRRAVTDGTACLCTPYKPSAGFSVPNAMGRNKLIYALSAATFVVTSEIESGGTWAGATEALRQRIAPVLVWLGDGAAAGNPRLAGRGALGVASLEELFPLPAHAPDEPSDPAQQLAMEV
jgi:predicted Rossmann fold nucleotide-binding protein DprA/Smf involved in DNA uptake